MRTNAQEAVLSAYIASIGKRTPRDAAQDAAELCRFANSLSRLNEMACNCGLTERQEQRKQNLQTRIKAVLERAGLVLNHFESDPQGYAVYLGLPMAPTTASADGTLPQFVSRFPAAKQNKTAPTKTRAISARTRGQACPRVRASFAASTGRTLFPLTHSSYPFPLPIHRFPFSLSHFPNPFPFQTHTQRT